MRPHRPDHRKQDQAPTQSEGQPSTMTKSVGMPSNLGALLTGKQSGSNGSVNKQQGDRNSESKHSQGNRRKTYCYGCGDPNHLLPDCPRKASLKVVQLRNSSAGMVIDGTISGTFCSDIFVDSGAEVTVVHHDVVSENAYLDRTILISGFQNRDTDFTECPVAYVQIKAGDVSGHFKVAVCDGIGYSALLGRDLGWESVRSLVDLAITKKKQQEQHQFIVEPIRNSEEYYGAPMSSS